MRVDDGYEIKHEPLDPRNPFAQQAVDFATSNLLHVLPLNKKSSFRQWAIAIDIHYNLPRDSDGWHVIRYLKIDSVDCTDTLALVVSELMKIHSLPKVL